MSSQQSQKKLKMLCLHGFNNTIETIKFMTQEFRKMFDHIMEFHFVEAPHNVVGVPETQLTARGFKGPFKTWFLPQVKNGEIQQNIFEGVEQSMDVILKAIEEHGPFDGVLCFSSGSAMFRMFYILCNYIQKEKYAHISQPKFVINIGGTMIPDNYVLIENKLYSQVDFKYPIDALHIYGMGDPFLQYVIPSIKVFTGENTIITHDKGHMVPRTFTDENFQKITNFLKDKYIKRFEEEDGFQVEQFRPRL